MRISKTISRNAKLAGLFFLAIVLLSSGTYKLFFGNENEVFLKIKSNPTDESYYFLLEFSKAFNTGSDTKEFFINEDEYNVFQTSFYLDKTNFIKDFKLIFDKEPNISSYPGRLIFKGRPKSPIDVHVSLHFDVHTKNYLISNIKLGNLSSVSSYAISNLVKKIDDINQFSCLRDDQGTNYVRLKHKNPFNKEIV